MTRDHNGQLHAGTIGLFDDPDEIEAAELKMQGQKAIAERKARKRQEKRQMKKYENKLKQHEKPSFLQHVSELFRGREKENGAERLLGTKKHTVAMDRAEKNSIRESSSDGEDGEMFEVWEVDTDLDSPFYKELGLARTKAANGMDVKVVHKSQIRSSDALEDYGE